MSGSRRIPPGLRYTARLATTGEHELFFAEFGADDGLPVLHLHGGPGSGANPADSVWCCGRRFWRARKTSTGISDPAVPPASCQMTMLD